MQHTSHKILDQQLHNVLSINRSINDVTYYVSYVSQQNNAYITIDTIVSHKGHIYALLAYPTHLQWCVSIVYIFN